MIKYLKSIEEYYQIMILSDCESVLNFLYSFLKIKLNLSKLYPIKREILRIKTIYKIKIVTFKVVAYQDDKLPNYKLLFLEKVNIICNKKAKLLIQQENRKSIPFPFQLTLPYIMYIGLRSQIVINFTIISLYNEPKSILPKDTILIQNKQHGRVGKQYSRKYRYTYIDRVARVQPISVLLHIE